MPTVRPRIVVTETNELADALDQARRHWPEDADSRSRLLLHLVEVGHQAITEEDRRDIERRRQVIRSHQGAATGMYEADYLEQLREDWPE